MKNQVEHYDIGILGGGPAGYVGAIRAAQLGKKVCVIEKEEVGGTCLLHGCIPTKALLSTAELFYKIQHAQEMGLILEGEVKPDYPKIVQRKENIVKLMVNGIKNLLKSYQIPLYHGNGYIKNSRTIELTQPDGSKKLISVDNLLIATGSRPSDIPGFTFDGKRILSSTDILQMKEIPKSLLILGAGPTGCEFAFIFAELGTEVTVVEIKSHALPFEDSEISEILERQFRKRKIRLLTETQIVSLELPEGNPLKAHLKQKEPIHAEKLLVSIGRAFNTQNLGLQEIGIQLGAKNEILVNEKMETNIPGIYAVGDVTGIALLAHVASKQAVVAVENICGLQKKMDYRVIPWNTFTHPPVSRVGMTEEECKEKKIDYRTGKFHFRTLGAAHISNELDGMVKIIADTTNDEILGVHIIGSKSSELIHEAVIAMQKRLTVEELGDAIHSHPTMSEGILEAVHDVHHQSIHSLKKS